MSTLSMTGFGRASAMVAGLAHAVEIRAVNHRYLDFKIRLPRGLNALEAPIRAALKARLHRGRIEVVVSNGAVEGAATTGVSVNLDLARDVHHALVTIGQRLQFEAQPTLNQVAHWPGVIVPSSDALDATEAAAQILPAVEAALDDLVAMRAAEGAALARDIVGYLDAVAADQQALLACAPEQNADYRERLHGRMVEMLAHLGAEPDEGRLLQEVAIFAEKTDVAEELARLESHLAQARGLLGTDGPVGRRLDFLCQEMFREANTVGSKVQDAALSGRVVDLKARLERLREQVQNVE